MVLFTCNAERVVSAAHLFHRSSVASLCCVLCGVSVRWQKAEPIPSFHSLLCSMRTCYLECSDLSKVKWMIIVCLFLIPMLETFSNVFIL